MDSNLEEFLDSYDTNCATISRERVKSAIEKYELGEESSFIIDSAIVDYWLIWQDAKKGNKKESKDDA